MTLLMILGRPLLLIIALLMLAAVMSGCATTRGIIRDELLTCMPAPPSPVDKPGVTQRDVGLYIDELAFAGEDCRSKLGSVRELVHPETK